MIQTENIRGYGGWPLGSELIRLTGVFDRRISAGSARMAELVDAPVLKTEALPGRAGSNPAAGTTIATKGLKTMANARDQMKTIEVELERVRGEIERLRLEEAVLVRLLNKLGGNPAPTAPIRTRAPSVKPVVLDVMREAGTHGATTLEVDDRVRQKVPSVKKDTVGSILSRLKSEGALVYAGERYYEKQFAPKDPNPFDRLRAVN